MKVILYIGHHKVGSTSLQLFLAQNWLRLVRNGILYPMTEGEGMAVALGAALRDSGRIRNLPINAREPHNTLAFRMISQRTGAPPPPFLGEIPFGEQMGFIIRAQVDRLKPHTVILCSEVMSNFGDVPGDPIAELKDLFPGAEFEIYCALRRPDDYLVSWQAQRLRFGHKVERLCCQAPQGFAEGVHGIHFDYRLLLQTWLEHFPESRFHIRNYDDVLAAGGSCEDFTARVGVAFPDALVAARRANPSLSLAFMEIVRRGNHALERKQAEELFRFLLRTRPPKRFRNRRKVEMFGVERRAAMVEAFAPIHDFLGNVTGQAPFFPDIAEIGTPREIPEEDAARHALAGLLRRPALPYFRPSRPVWGFLKDLAAEMIP